MKKKNSGQSFLMFMAPFLLIFLIVAILADREQKQNNELKKVCIEQKDTSENCKKIMGLK